MHIRELDESGFTVVPGPVPPEELDRLAAAYDEAVDSALPDDIRVGSSTTRVNDFVNRGPEFDAIHWHPPLLEACGHILRQPFRLSTMHVRTLRQGLAAQDLHVDYARDEHGWTMVGFIFMVDAFRPENGATRFVPGSHLGVGVPEKLPRNRKDDCPGQVLACGPAGSMIVYNGAVWHGHTVNRSGRLRRSIQGAFVRQA
jgi:ectoine hydroxylase-related dioxygenase (phytanoyl-CoA dioxygenase family)